MMTPFPVVVANFYDGEVQSPLRFTRSSVGVSMRRDGLAQVPPNALRTSQANPYRAEGALLERRSVNLLANSEGIGDNPWVRVAVDARRIHSGREGPIPGAQPFVISDTRSGGIHVLFQDVQAPGQQVVFTGFFRARDLTKIQLLVNDGGPDNIHAGFDLAIGKVVLVRTEGASSAAGAEIEDFGNGWWRCALSGKMPPAAIYRAHVFLVNDDRMEYVGRQSEIYVWGLQLEAGVTPTSFIATPADQPQCREAEELTLAFEEKGRTLKSIVIELEQGARHSPAPIFQLLESFGDSEVSLWQEGDEIFAYASIDGQIAPLQQGRLPVTDRPTRRIGVRLFESYVEVWASGTCLFKLVLGRGLECSRCYIGCGTGPARWDGVLSAVEAYCDAPGPDRMQAVTA